MYLVCIFFYLNVYCKSSGYLFYLPQKNLENSKKVYLCVRLPSVSIYLLKNALNKGPFFSFSFMGIKSEEFYIVFKNKNLPWYFTVYLQNAPNKFFKRENFRLTLDTSLYKLKLNHK
jgi:hypothetical protein